MLLQTVFAIFFLLSIISILLFSYHKYLKIDFLISLPLSLIILIFSLYIVTLFTKNGYIALLIGFFLTIILGKSFQSFFPPQKTSHLGIYIPLAFIISLIICIPRLPYLVELKNWDTVLLSGIGDETKHFTVLTSITAWNTFLPFPYDPNIYFSYYYFFYLLPGLILKIFPQANMGVLWLIYLFISQLSLYFAFFNLLLKFCGKSILNICTFILFSFGGSLKIFPKLFNWFGVSEKHIEHWYILPSFDLALTKNMVGWQITHPITLALWVPQHQFALLGALLLINVIINQSAYPWKRVFLEAMLFTVIFGSSSFIGIAILGIYLIYRFSFLNKKILINTLVTVLLFCLLIFPLILSFNNIQAQIIFKPYLPVLPHINSIVGILLFYLLELGLIFPILIFMTLRYIKLSLFGIKKDNLFSFLLIGTFFPLILSRLFQSSFMNDFGMRSSSLFLVFSPLLFIYLIQKKVFLAFNNKKLLSILFFSIIISLSAGIMEIYFRTASFEIYSIHASRIYNLVTRYSKPTDIIISNDAYTADRIPVLSRRLTIKPFPPFSLDVYAPKRNYPQGETYGDEICSLFSKLNQTKSYNFLYLELKTSPRISCNKITEKIQNLIPVYSSLSISIYKL